eukprot:scaffold166_cov106-Skeletonema_dohrnii-CCMP3373.AAC.5
MDTMTLRVIVQCVLGDGDVARPSRYSGSYCAMRFTSVSITLVSTLKYLSQCLKIVWASGPGRE